MIVWNYGSILHYDFEASIINHSAFATLFLSIFYHSLRLRYHEVAQTEQQHLDRQRCTSFFFCFRAIYTSRIIEIN